MAVVATPSSVESLNQWMADRHMRGYWAGRGEGGRARPTEPRSAVLPHVWRWADIQEALDGAARYVTLADAFRRNILFLNPVAEPKTMIFGVQMILPGERAPAHRHTNEAIRFVIQGDPRAASVVDGEPMPMETGDLVLTPNWSWHDHINDSDQPVIWVDGLTTIPGLLGLRFMEDYPSATQPHDRSSGTSVRTSGALRPRSARPNGSASLPGVPYRYPWRETIQSIEAPTAAEPDPCDGQVFDYTNPWTGGPTLPCLACSIRRIETGTTTRSYRCTATTVYHVVRGQGTTQIGDVTISWGARDFFCVPPWSWHHHQITLGDDALLFAMSDRGMLDGLGLYREEIESEAPRRDRGAWFGPGPTRP